MIHVNYGFGRYTTWQFENDIVITYDEETKILAFGMALDTAPVQASYDDLRDLVRAIWRAKRIAL
jgi:hypothetical protein